VLSWTYFEAARDCFSFAKSMHHLGVEERKSVNIMGFNAPEWTTAYLGAMFNNCVATGVYNTNAAEACLYQAQHSEAQVIVVDTFINLKKFLINKDQLKEVKAYVVWLENDIPAEFKLPNVFLWKQFLDLGKSVPDSVIN
jgi:long-chain-fatty-acid--CoA ligase ACSBG